MIAKASLVIKAERKTVWEALTNPTLVKQYFFGTDLFCHWKVGDSIVFKGEWNGKTYEDKGYVLKFDPFNELAYSYLSSLSGLADEEENYAKITYTLNEVNNGTELSISQSGMANEKAKEDSEKNWIFILDEIKKLLEK